MKKEVIAIDLGGTNLRTALISDNKIIKYNKVKTPKTTNEIVYLMISEVSKLITKDVKGIGIASPGPLKNGIIINPPNLPFKNFNLQSALEKKFKKKVVVTNDAKCVALAESKLGVKKKNFIILTLGTGIGGGVIINSELYFGEGNGGELGHIIIQDGKDMEYWAAYKAQKRRTLEVFGKELLTIDLLKMKSNEKAKKILEETADYLGRGIASLIHVFDPEIVVLAGGVKETGEPFLDMIKAHTKKYSIFKHNTPIVWSKLKEPGLLGAGLLIK